MSNRVLNTTKPSQELATPGYEFPALLGLSFGVDPLREVLQAMDVKVRMPTEEELTAPAPLKEDKVNGWDIAPSTSRKKAMTWDAAVGCLSWALYCVACNYDALVAKFGEATIHALQAEGSKLIEPAADGKHLKHAVYAPMQQFMSEVSRVIFSLEEVTSSSPASLVEWARNKGVKVVKTKVTTRMEEVKSRFKHQWLNLSMQFSTQQERVYLMVLKKLLSVSGEYETKQEENRAIFDAAVKRLEKLSHVEDLFFALLQTKKASGARKSALYKAKAWSKFDQEKVGTAASMASSLGKHKDLLADLFTYEKLLSFILNVDTDTGAPLDYVPLSEKNRLLMATKQVSSFGFNLYAYNKDVLYAAFLVRETNCSPREAMSKVTEANGRAWKDYAETMVQEVAEDGKYVYEGSDFDTDFNSQLGSSLLPLSDFLVKAPTALPLRDNDGKIYSYAPQKSLRVDGLTLKELVISIDQSLMGGKFKTSKDLPIGNYLAESLRGQKTQKVEISNVGTHYRVETDAVEVGDKFTVSVAGDHTIMRVLNTGAKFEKRLGIFGMYAQGHMDVAGLEPVIIDVPEWAEDLCEGFMMMNPADAKHLPGVYVGGRGAWDMWGANGLLKVVPRVHPKCPKGKVFVTPNFTKGKEIGVVRGSSKIVYMYKHEANKAATTNRSLFHREDLMLHACNEYAKSLETDVVLEKAAQTIKRTVGSVPCTAMFSIMAEQAIGNSEAAEKGNLPIANSTVLYLRSAYKELNEHVKDNELVINSIGEGIVSLATFAEIAKVTGGPDQDDAFPCWFCTDGSGKFEVTRNPQVAGDGYDLITSVRREA
jgi:hypothetical protein